MVVLEARDRVGGRALSLQHKGIDLDLGAQWLAEGQASSTLLYLSCCVELRERNTSEDSIRVCVVLPWS